jgi:hypothetical protein
MLPIIDGIVLLFWASPRHKRDMATNIQMISIAAGRLPIRFAHFQRYGL